MTRARTAVIIAAAVATLVGVIVSPVPPDWRMVPAVVGAVLAQLLVVRFRSQAGVFHAAWGESALIVGLYLVPAGWFPLTYLTGTALAFALRAGAHRRPENVSVPRVLATLTLAAATGAGISYAVADPYGGPLTARMIVGLFLGAVGYLLVTTGVTTGLAAIGRRTAFLPLFTQAVRHKVLMFTGNVVVGLLVVAATDLDFRWLVGLPLILALLHATYASRLRVSEHRRMWRAFASATKALNQSEKAAVAAAAVRGALEVFAVGRAEVELNGVGGPRRWVGDHNGKVAAAPPRGPGEAGVAVPLQVAGDRIGTLWVHFPSDLGPKAADDAALQAYADAVAAALRDTVTHAELHELLARSARDAQHDPLTGLLNRATLMARGGTAIQLVPHARPVALLLVNIDHFREINDNLGHAAGDEVLRVAAARLRAATGSGELLARLGGDEFALLVTGAWTGDGDVVEQARRRGRELVERLAEPPADINGVPVSIAASVGVVVAPAGTAEISELLRRADAALAEAKRTSDPVGWYDGDKDRGEADRPALLAELRSALDRDNELVLLLQPVVDLRSGAPLAVEALVRWRHPRRGVLVPADFIRLIEHSDLLGTFTGYVIDRALAAAVALPHDGDPLPVAVNLSARSLLDPRLPGQVARLLRRHGVPGRRLMLEITEAVMSPEPTGLDDALTGLRSLGVRLAVDDFGTGHASLTFITRVAVDEVKVDRSLVADMLHSPQAAAIVRTTVGLGRDLGMRVVAEGVETAAQREMLVQIGCEAAQGFHFAEPVSVERARDLLRAWWARAQRTVVAGLRGGSADRPRASTGDRRDRAG
ncbi:MAG TPA: bifunctional diguanylate cyclase/phosphodiesterase [Natronosporangium sp.]|nr:bifunctional diguanylate cyclase/phosphodiesterase [Natronosporangium sp.]